MIQDGRGRLFVGSDTLLMYDGVSWISQPIPDSHDIFALAFGPDGRLWTGAYNQIGYYTESPTGAFAFTSLLPLLPAEHRRFETIWACGYVGSQLYFVCQSKVFRWDGVGFTVWDFPRTSRLYPVRLGDELWFTHMATGLYRLTAEGPRLEYAPKDLPGRPAFGLIPTPEGLRILSREGLCRVTQPGDNLSSPELREFLRTRPLSSFQPLPDGNFAIGTLGGLGIMSPEGRLLRSLGQEDGLAGNAINTLLLDRENQLWIGHSYGGLTRLDARGSVSFFNQWGRSDHAGFLNLTQIDGWLLAITDAGLFRLEKDSPGFAPLGPLPAQIFDAVPTPDGLLLSRYGGIDFFDGRQIHARLDAHSQQVWRILAAQKKPGDYFCLIERKIARLSADAESRWQREDLGELPELANQCYLDPLDNLWFSSAQTGVWHFDTTARRFTNLQPGPRAGATDDQSQLTGHGTHVYFFSNRAAYHADIATRKFTRLEHYPVRSALRTGLSADGRRLYVLLARETTANYGLGRLQLDETGRTGAFTELAVPKLETVGPPATMLITGEDGADSLWIGGSEGLIKIKPAELPPVSAPAAPWLQVITNATQPGEPATIPTLAFFGHHISVRLSSSEINARPQLRFQTRLDSGDWSPPSPLARFEFTNLTNGTYRFEARTVNPAGLTSAPVAYAFRISPPWYRTPWAYAASLLALAATSFGYVRFHNRRIRRRNQLLESLVRDRTTALTKANAAKDEFLANISHEIRNPMNGVIGIAHTIDSSHLEPAARQHLAQLRQCATHLSSLLEDILDYSRLQSGAVDLHPEAFDLPELLGTIAAMTAAESRRTGIPVEISLPPSVPRRLIGDATRLRQILLNYVVNALKYSGRGRVVLSVRTDPGPPGTAALTFTVRDDGPGIAAEEQARLFKHFERGTAAHTRRIAGSGLGLAVCKTIGDSMGARLWVDSEPGHGATFHLALPLPIADDDAPLPLANPRDPGPAAAHRHALVVDDEEYNRIALTGFLREIGFTVTAVADGEAALAVARTQELQAVFLDLNLPGRDGIEITRLLRSLPALDPQLPVIATTAYTTTERRAACSAAGMSAFLTKPVSLEKILTALAHASALQRSAASLQIPDPTPAGNPLGNLRLLAQRKGTTLAAETATFLAELAQEEQQLAQALASRLAPAAADAAHRLTGRFGFIHATAEARLSREIEAACASEFWDRAETAATRLSPLLPALRERLGQL